MQEVFIEIIPWGILPALRVHHFWLKKAGILETKDGSVCLKCLIQQKSIKKFDLMSLDFLFKIFCACTAQDCFQLLSTSILEVVLFGMVQQVACHKYVFTDFQNLTLWL